MADPRFFTVAGPFKLGELAELTGARIARGADPELILADVASLATAAARDLSFLDNKRYLPAFEASAAGACIVDPQHADRAPSGMALLLTPHPYKAYAIAARAFYPPAASLAEIHDTALIDPSAKIGSGTAIGAYAVIGAEVEIGAGCRLGPHVAVDRGVVIGDDTEIGAGASLSHCLVGRRCQFHPGVRIGSRGFGFALDPGGYVDVPQLGRVIVEDDVEIGANSTVDRGAGPDTVIGAGSKIDNLVQIGHNVRLGRGCVLVAQSGVAGSSELQDFAMLGAQGGIAGHLRIGAGAQVAAKSGVMRDVPAGASVCGSPALPIKEFFRLVAIWQRQLRAQRKSND